MCIHIINHITILMILEWRFSKSHIQWYHPNQGSFFPSCLYKSHGVWPNILQFLSFSKSSHLSRVQSNPIHSQLNSWCNVFIQMSWSSLIYNLHWGAKLLSNQSIWSLSESIYCDIWGTNYMCLVSLPVPAYSTENALKTAFYHSH